MCDSVYFHLIGFNQFFLFSRSPVRAVRPEVSRPVPVREVLPEGVLAQHASQESCQDSSVHTSACFCPIVKQCLIQFSFLTVLKYPLDFLFLAVPTTCLFLNITYSFSFFKVILSFLFFNSAFYFFNIAFLIENLFYENYTVVKYFLC